MDLQHGLPFNLLDWAETNKSKLAPPVCNTSIFPDTSFVINMVGGPNTRTDFHQNPFEEIFYQIKGNAHLIIWDRGQFEDVNLRPGDIFLLPAGVFHSPQRPEAGLCFLIEQTRPEGDLDSLQWYCGKCANLIWRAEMQLKSLVEDLPKVYQIFYALSDEERRCSKCGTVHPGRDYKTWSEHLKLGNSYKSMAGK